MNVSRETIVQSFVFCAFYALFSVFIAGCGEDTVLDDISGFNKIIEKRTDIRSAREVMKGLKIFNRRRGFDKGENQGYANQ